MPRWDVKFEYAGGKSETVEDISANNQDAALRVAMALRLSHQLPKHGTVNYAQWRNRA